MEDLDKIRPNFRFYCCCNWILEFGVKFIVADASGKGIRESHQSILEYMWVIFLSHLVLNNNITDHLLLFGIDLRLSKDKHSSIGNIINTFGLYDIVIVLDSHSILFCSYKILMSSVVLNLKYNPAYISHKFDV